MSKNKNDERKKYMQQIEDLTEQINVQQMKRNEVKRTLDEYEFQFQQAERKINFLSRLVKRFITFFRSIAAYALGRRNVKHLYSRTFKIKNAINQLKASKYYLYDLGFIEKSLEDLKDKLHHTDDPYVKRAINWELGLWYANQLSESGARRSLAYIHAFIKGEKDKDILRRATILQAENLEQLNYKSLGKDLLTEALEIERHPDLFLAMANLEETIESRLHWINKAMNDSGLQEITFKKGNEQTTYDDLQTKPMTKEIQDGPKVSVLLPAYNAEEGIQIAIESILEQTWQNLELIVIDDCSTDDTVKVVKRYVQADDRVKLFSTPENSGPYVARNIGLQHATGEFITVNDADDWSHAEKIEIQAKHLLDHSQIIANTSEHARLTEDLKLYRRGTPGTYIFPNMSSLMFRRQPVMEKLGYWDCVRFAADGEFKRRLIKQFGAERVVDLKTGPLSLPRQSKTSLTASSAFGYSGFFMGARKEYVASFSHYHDQADTLYYPYPLKNRLFPVPEPMWPKREKKQLGRRHFDVMIAGDFQKEEKLQLSTVKEITVHKNLGIRTGIMHMSCYNMRRPKELNSHIRNIVNGTDVQTLVYGEDISCDVLIIKGHSVLQEKQKYLPNIKPKMVAVVMDRDRTHIRQCSHRLMDEYGKRGIWFASDQHEYDELQEKYQHELSYIHMANKPWGNDQEIYQLRLEDWITDENPYIK